LSCLLYSRNYYVNIKGSQYFSSDKRITSCTLSSRKGFLFMEHAWNIL
jgi:hypothetical protein